MAKAKQAAQAKKTVTVTLVKSPIGFQKVQGKVAEGMGLRKTESLGDAGRHA